MDPLEKRRSKKGKKSGTEFHIIRPEDEPHEMISSILSSAAKIEKFDQSTK